MTHYYEVYKKPTSEDVFPEANAFDTLEEAFEFADANEITFIAEIGGAWDEYGKCATCGEWKLYTDLNVDGICDTCTVAEIWKEAKTHEQVVYRQRR